VFGSHRYIHHVRVPGMLHGRVIRPALPGAEPVRVELGSIATIRGARVLRKGRFIAVVAER